MPTETRILAVDDEPDFLALFKDNLEDSGNFVVETESDPCRAVERAREFKPDLMLVDVVMPVMDGGDVVAALKADPRLARVPVIMLTALVEEKSVAGGLPFMPKTSSLDEILALIEKTLAG